MDPHGHWLSPWAAQPRRRRGAVRGLRAGGAPAHQQPVCRGARLNLPWPRRLGTPPWGAKKELEFGAARRGTTYAIRLLRPDDAEALGAHFDELLRLVADGEPGLLYVGNATVPRHVVLILPDRGDGNLEVYDPASGGVSELTRSAITGHRLGLSGWDVPWFCVEPSGLATERTFEWSPGAVPA